MRYSSFNWVVKGKRGWIFGPFRGRTLTVTWKNDLAVVDRECVCGKHFRVVIEHARPWTVCSDCMIGSK